MRNKPAHPRHRGMRAGILGTFVAMLAMLVASVGAAPAQAVNGVGFASARGTDPAAQLGESTVEAQFSAIANCDAAQSTRPFYVRWTAGGTTYLFKKTSTDPDPNRTGCGSAAPFAGGPRINAYQGFGAGTVNGTPGATVFWLFGDGSAIPQGDYVGITITPSSGDPLQIGVDPNPATSQPQPLNGTPGGVWVFGELPWPCIPGAC